MAFPTSSGAGIRHRTLKGSSTRSPSVWMPMTRRRILNSHVQSSESAPTRLCLIMQRIAGNLCQMSSWLWLTRWRRRRSRRRQKLYVNLSELRCGCVLLRTRKLGSSRCVYVLLRNKNLGTSENTEYMRTSWDLAWNLLFIGFRYIKLMLHGIHAALPLINN